jgi:nicotinamide-nucleotide amidase
VLLQLSAPDDSALAKLAVRVGEQLLARRLTVVTAESCTGGLVAKLLTDVPGSSKWFDCGYVTYSNQAKQRDLAVTAETLRAFGAVSEQTVVQMAVGALSRSDADRAVAVSGVAGPDGGTTAHPVGDVWFAVATRTSDGTTTHARNHRFSGDRDAVRRQSAAFALELLGGIPARTP